MESQIPYGRHVLHYHHKTQQEWDETVIQLFP